MAYLINHYEWMTGKEWISMPRVMVNTGKGYKDFEAESKLIYHTANMIKLGDTVSCEHYPRDPKRGKGTTWGREWIARIVNPSRSKTHVLLTYP